MTLSAPYRIASIGPRFYIFRDGRQIGVSFPCLEWASRRRDRLMRLREWVTIYERMKR